MATAPTAAGRSNGACPVRRRGKGKSASMAAALTMVAASDDRPVWIPSLWTHQRAVVVFLRHIGCRFCKAQVLALNRIAPALEAAGIPLVYLSMGSPTQAREISEKLGLIGTLYLDPSMGGTTEDLRSAATQDQTGATATATATGGGRQASKAYALFALLRGTGVVQDKRTAALGAALMGEGVLDEEKDEGGAWPGDIFQVRALRAACVALGLLDSWLVGLLHDTMPGYVSVVWTK
jgi:peroxiredoxin